MDSKAQAQQGGPAPGPPPVTVYAFPTTAASEGLRGMDAKPLAAPKVRLAWYDRILAWLVYRLSLALTRSPGNGTV